MAAARSLTLDSARSTEYPSLFAWRTFSSIAPRIKHWELGLEEEEVEALFSIDPNIKKNIKSLSLVSRSNGNIPILESNSSRFLALLGSLSSLTTLSISPSCLPRTDDMTDSVSPNALSTPYEFASTLTSFTWFGDEEVLSVDFSLLKLLARFTSLRFLKINAFNFDGATVPADEPKVLFPRLIELDLACEEILMLDRILEVMDLPKLEVLRLSFNSPGPDREFLLESEGFELQQFYSRISENKPNLRHVYLSVAGGFYEITLDHLRTGSIRKQGTEPSYCLHVDWQPGLPEMEASGADFDSALKKDEIIEGLVNGIEDMSLWVKHEVEGIKVSEDVPKASSLVKAMRPLHELRRWSEV
ncbi:uncharacterized protein JCM6883_006592 [Sporobolomyces salmoneus]|uniref:uncharacterized protein n=1 Tax=Sporobolomyces salmoneus TaxID=183962 RepID=UPI003171CFDE